MPPKKPITREQYNKLLNAGYTAAEIAADGLVLAPSNAPSKVQTEPDDGVDRAPFAAERAFGRKVVENLKPIGQGVLAVTRGIPFSDEFMGLASAAQSTLTGKDPVTGRPAAKTFGERFAQGSSDARQAQSRAVEDLGFRGKIAEAAGYAIPVTRTVKAVQTGVGMGLKGAQLLKQILASSGTGLTAGTVSGFSHGTGWDERIQNAQKEGALGALFGAGATALAAGGRAVGRYLGFRPELTARELAAEALVTAAERGAKRSGTPKGAVRGFFGMRNNNPDVQMQDVRALRDRITAPTTTSGKLIADATPEMQELAMDASRASPVVESTLESISKRRVAQEPSRIASDFAEGIGAVPGVDSDVASHAIDKATQQFENTLYDKLWASYPNPVPNDRANKVFNIAKLRLKSHVNSLINNKVLDGEPIADVVQMVNGDMVPTLEGMHRLKSGIGEVISNLQKVETTTGLNEKATQQLRSLQKYQERLRETIREVPGGDIWEALQLQGAQSRSLIDAAESGKGLMSGEFKGFTALQALNKAGQSAAGPNAQRMLRQGAATRIADKARQNTRETGAQDIWRKIATTDAAQDVVNALSPSTAGAREFRDRMRDRVAMATTDAQQLGKRTTQKEILRGAQRAGTARAIGEAATVGNIVFDPAAAVAPAKMATGAVVASKLAGRRNLATELAAEDLGTLLGLSPNTRFAPELYMNMATALQRLQARRAALQSGFAAFSPYFTSTRENR